MSTIPERVYRKRLSRSGVPIKYLAMRLEDWEPYDEKSARAKKDAQVFIDMFPKLLAPADDGEIYKNVGRGIALVGDPGAGKTTLGCAILREIHQRYEKRVMFRAFADYIAMLQEQMSLQRAFETGDPQASERWWEIHRIKAAIFNVPFLWMDDVGKEYRTGSGFAEGEFDRLLRWRFRNALPTGLSTNIPLEKWGKTYNPSMGSFVHEAFHAISMGGRDLRNARV
ncbi:hypothetical protein AB0K16_22445 [Nonomuraea jabiensis]|uniref:hypothetical protein n=1 Tax=Nonomuraea jabiensis TaxID=882448 RepID=UPI00344A5773